MTTTNSSEASVHANIQRLLAQYSCPRKFHEVRTAFMGAIASPYIVDPAFELNALWDGEFPELPSEAALTEVTELFLKDFWSLLTKHTDPELPFELTPLSQPASMDELKSQALLRGEELDAFLTGFFQDQEDLELDADVADSLDVLEELVEMYSGIVNMDDSITGSAAELADLSANMKKITEMAEAEINNIIINYA